MIWRAVVTLTHPALGGTGTNTWHLRVLDGAVIDEAAAGAVVMETVRQFYDGIKGIFAGGTLVRWDGALTGVGPDEGTFGNAGPWSVSPEGGSDPLPPATSICVGWIGTSGDRSRRGRTFLGPLGTNTLQDNGTPTESVLTLIREEAAQLIAANSPADDGSVGVWSRQEGIIRDIVQSSVANQFAVLRSRRD